MKEPPAKTFAHVLQDLYTVPSAFVACLEWQRLTKETETAVADLDIARRELVELLRVVQSNPWPGGT